MTHLGWLYQTTLCSIRSGCWVVHVVTGLKIVLIRINVFNTVTWRPVKTTDLLNASFLQGKEKQSCFSFVTVFLFRYSHWFLNGLFIYEEGELILLFRAGTISQLIDYPIDRH